MTTQSQNEPKALLRRFAAAINAHDLDAIVSCFAPDYHDVEPAHPRRQIVGGEEVVRKNWGTVLRSVTDFRTEVQTIAAEGDVGLIEHDWSGTKLDGTRLHLRGVNVFGVRNGQFAWGRIYLESVEEEGMDLDERVRQMAEGETAPRK
jgi:ketosteroid isomerase-like protein